MDGTRLKAFFAFQPLLEQHLRVRVSPVIREDGSGTNTYNIEAISSSDSDSDSDDVEESAESHIPQPPDASLNTTNEDFEMLDGGDGRLTDIEALDDDSNSSSSSDSNDEPLAGFSPNLEPVNASWSSSSGSSSTNSTDSDIQDPI